MTIKVSIIVPTFNNAATIGACLESIAAQTYPIHELIVVDKNSTDETAAIARKFTDQVYFKEPERSTQRNFGVQQATGDWVVIIDSDMQLSPTVIAACADVVEANPAVTGIIIPEESFGEGFWAKCKQLERSFYVGVDWIEAARFFKRDTFLQVGGYDEQLVSGEDWDLSQRVAEQGKLARVQELIHHNEGRLQLFKTLRKKSYYAKQFTKYTTKKAPSKQQSNPYAIVLKRFWLFLSQPRKLWRNPALGFGVLFMKVCEFGFGAFGYWGAGQEEREHGD